MTTANTKLSKTRLFDPNKVSEEFALKLSGDCMSPIVEDGEYVVVDRRKKIKKGDLVVIYFKPEYVAQGKFQAGLKRLCFSYPSWAKFPFVYEPKSGKYGDFGPIIFVEQLNPPKTHVVDLRTVLGIYHAERCPADVLPVVTPVPNKALLKRPKAKRDAKLRRAA